MLVEILTGKARSGGIRMQGGQGSGLEPHGSQPSLALVLLMVSASLSPLRLRVPRCTAQRQLCLPCTGSMVIGFQPPLPGRKGAASLTLRILQVTPQREPLSLPSHS